MMWEQDGKRMRCMKCDGRWKLDEQPRCSCPSSRPSEPARPAPRRPARKPKASPKRRLPVDEDWVLDQLLANYRELESEVSKLSIDALKERRQNLLAIRDLLKDRAATRELEDLGAQLAELRTELDAQRGGARRQ